MTGTEMTRMMRTTGITEISRMAGMTKMTRITGMAQRVHNRGSQISLSRLFFFSIPPSHPILCLNPDPVPFFFYKIFCLIIEIDVI